MNEHPAAIPWYKSPLYLSIATSLLAHLCAYAPKVAAAFGLIDPATISVVATDILQGIGVVSLIVAERLRAQSKLQPVTLTQSSATKVSDEKAQSLPATPVPAPVPPASNTPPNADGLS